MKTLVFALLLIVSIVHAEQKKTHLQLPYAKAIALLEGIREDAIILGEGKTEVYVFVDPLCPHSRKFIRMVSQNAQMLAKYRYYVYLYSIPRLKSERTVSAIFASKVPAQMLLKVMVGAERHAADVTAPTQKRVDEIEAVARAMDVYKRPYLMVALRP
ncbi:hypothetical protein WCX72_00700 [Sulfurimonas sp. HSL1-6]|uniref:hypothetical protein n=1 Tax=Thiomicrolovo immobilis TaxID=3131935 RepID=UPI0031F87387